MNRLELILSATLALSALLNIGLFLYVRAVLVRFVSTAEELGDLQTMVNSFTAHLQSVYELDSFYGDETLHGLLEHAISFNEQMYTFDYIISLIEEDEEKNETTEEETLDDETTPEENAP
jgi:hypothetical protein